MHRLTNRTLTTLVCLLALVAVGVTPLLAAPQDAADAQTFTVDPIHSEATFQVRHLFTKVRGNFNDFQGTVEMDPENPEASHVEFTIDVASIDTDNDKRDQHLRSEDFFWVEKHPEITFVSDEIQKTAANTYAVTGTFTMRGVSKKITLPVKLLGTGTDPWGNTRAGFSTETVIDRQEYGVSWNQALDQGGYVLGDDVEVQVQIQAVQQAPDAEAAAAAE